MLLTRALRGAGCKAARPASAWASWMRSRPQDPIAASEAGRSGNAARAAGATSGSAPSAAGAVHTSAAPNASNSSGSGNGRSRMYPDEPRVGVGVVCFRRPTTGRNPEVLLIRRAKEPAKGLWCFPGGSLELGESLAECAVRELSEEAGVTLRCEAVDSQGFSKGLRRPTAFAAVDSIVQDGSSSSGGGGGDTGEGAARIRFHYVVVEVAAMAQDPDVPLVPGDDVSEAVWMRVEDLKTLGDTLVINCERLAREAVERFDLTGQAL